ncbi:MAG TPA: hypothetical protein VN578_19745 [Candidatus Binatia bacterium]|jgi:hypothetical protein|nr:hypothetical protein [Candidatus Binatia bacterium]
MKKTKCSKIGFIFGAALLVSLTGCIGYVDDPRYARGYASLPPVYVESGVVVQDDYVYYPDYQVYYSGSTRQCVYLEGSAWVTRPAPPGISFDVMFASPSVRLAFHDSPWFHHATVVRQYPRHWAPPGSSHSNREGRDEGHGESNRRGHD